MNGSTSWKALHPHHVKAVNYERLYIMRSLYIMWRLYIAKSSASWEVSSKKVKKQKKTNHMALLHEKALHHEWLYIMLRMSCAPNRRRLKQKYLTILGSQCIRLQFKTKFFKILSCLYVLCLLFVFQEIQPD